jgi:bifunctional glutamyl/prolyl-tRNA synthetase
VELVVKYTAPSRSIKYLPLIAHVVCRALLGKVDHLKYYYYNIHNSTAMKTNWKIPKPIDKLFQSYKGPIVTRFPPEPSGYLHIGHIKALMINRVIATKYSGTLIVRFDDTNPATESQEYQDAILEDINKLNIKVDKLTNTSDYFPDIIKAAEILINNNSAYVDDTPPDQLSQERNNKIESRNRNNSIQQNMLMWTNMLSGTQTNCVLRIKIDPVNENGALRDPTIFRTSTTYHYRTKNTYKVYPTYDFACPIVDSLEQVSHVFRSVEFADRDDQYKIILQKLNYNCPLLNSYGKVTIQDSVLSKRKIKELISSNKILDWTDPRLLTVRGAMRRGLVIPALMDFIEECGFTKASVSMTPDKLWGINRKYVDKIATRYSAIENNNLKTVHVSTEDDIHFIDRFVKNKDLGQRPIYYSPTILVNALDAEHISKNNNGKVTLINWGNMRITNGTLTPIPEDKDYKDTLKILWLQNTSPNTDITIRTYKSVDEPPMDTQYLGEPDMRNIKVGNIVQLYKFNNYFICDSATSNNIILIAIP